MSVYLFYTYKYKILKNSQIMLAVIVDDNKQAAQDLAERLGDFDDVEIGASPSMAWMDWL